MYLQRIYCKRGFFCSLYNSTDLCSSHEQQKGASHKEKRSSTQNSILTPVFAFESGDIISNLRLKNLYKNEHKKPFSILVALLSTDIGPA